MMFTRSISQYAGTGFSRWRSANLENSIPMEPVNREPLIAARKSIKKDDAEYKL